MHGRTAGIFDCFSEAPLPTLITQHAKLSWSGEDLSDFAGPTCRELSGCCSTPTASLSHVKLDGSGGSHLWTAHCGHGFCFTGTVAERRRCQHEPSLLETCAQQPHGAVPCCSPAPPPSSFALELSSHSTVELGPAALLVLSHLLLSLSVLKEHVMGVEEARQS